MDDSQKERRCLSSWRDDTAEECEESIQDPIQSAVPSLIPREETDEPDDTRCTMGGMCRGVGEEPVPGVLLFR
jgi:hypothetical protein